MSSSPRVGRESTTAVAGAQTLLRALDILDCFADESSSLSLAEIGRRVELTAPTTHRLVKALMSRGFIVADGNRQYTLGPAVMRLSAVVSQRSDNLVSITTPSIERLREQIGETVSLHCCLGDERICVAERVSAEPIRMESGIGRIYPLYAGAAGKAMLAWLPDMLERISARLTPVGPATITDPVGLAQELVRIRKRGFAVSEGEVVAGATSLAAPVFGSNGVVVGAINVAGPSTRWNRARVAQSRDLVLNEAAHVMRLLASSGPPADAPR